MLDFKKIKHNILIINGNKRCDNFKSLLPKGRLTNVYNVCLGVHVKECMLCIYACVRVFPCKRM